MSGPGLSGIHLLPEELSKYSRKKKQQHSLIEVILQIQFEGREPAHDLQRGCKKKQEKMNSSSQAGLRRQARTADRPWGHSQPSNKHGRPPPPGQAALGNTQSTGVLSRPGGLVGLGTRRAHVCFPDLEVWSACGHHRHTDRSCPPDTSVQNQAGPTQGSEELCPHGDQVRL